MEKIEKLEEFNWVPGRDAITIALCNTIIRKQNEIINYLNTQPQTEEKYEKLIGDIKDLLLERERWAIDTFLKDTASYNSFHNGRPRTMRNGLSGEGFEVRVSKLKQ